ncbi:hypothetical protein [Nostoc sp.]|uniref:hypothetical protein n=1 Tax=Nostoc sp. TaxID=1180 RepID=UPI002FF43F70
MADIKINDIEPAGAELFGDDESFMDEISNNDLSQVFGGGQGVTILAKCKGTITILGNCCGCPKTKAVDTAILSA